MATNIVTNATVNISVNGQDAEQTLDNLRKRVKTVQDEIIRLRSAGVNRRDPQLQALYREYEDLSRMLRTCEREASQVDSVMRRLDTASPKELRATLKQLNRELETLHRGSDAWNRQTAQIRRVQSALNSVNAELREQQSRWSRLNRWLNDTQTAVMGLAAAFTGLVAAGRSAVQKYADIEESMMNTQKYTGLSAQQVRELNEQFKKIDTRLFRDELNELAQEGGRLGKNTKKSVMEYVEAAQIIKVALNDLGNGATQTIAKIANIFGEEKRLGTKKSMLAIGSAVNVLSQNCTASKPYLVEFAQRMAGIGAQAGLTVPQIIAFGAVLDSNGQKVEMSATAIQKVIMALAQKNKEYSEVLGLDAEKLSSTLKRSAKDGLLMYLEGIKKLSDKTSAKNATIALAPLFKDMGMDAARVATVLSTLAGHIGEIKSQLHEADKAYRDATSATGEFNMFNNTVQASIDKARGRMQEMAITLGEKLYPILKHIYTSSSLMLRALNELVTMIAPNIGKIVTLTVAIAAYKLTIRLAALETRGFSIAQKAAALGAAALRSAILLGNVALAAFSGNLTKAAKIWHLFARSLRLHPIGLIHAALSALLIVAGKLALQINELDRSLSKAMKSAAGWADIHAKEQKRIDDLVTTLREAAKGTDQYNRARNELISRYGAYLKGLIDEKGEINNLTQAYDRLSWAAEKSAQARGLANARKNLDEAYYESVNEKVTKLKDSLELLGMKSSDIARIIKAVNSSISKGYEVDGNIYLEVAAFASENGFWKRVRKDGVVSAVRNEIAGDDPAKIIRQLNYGTKVYNSRKEQLEDMDNRVLKGLPGYDIDPLIEQLQKELQNSVQDKFHVEFDGWTWLGADELAARLEEAIRDKEQKPNQLVFNIDGQQAKLGWSPDNNNGPSLGFQAPKRIFTEEHDNWLEGTLSRTEAERLLRELIFERSQRGYIPHDYENDGSDPDLKDKDLSDDSDDFSYKPQKELDAEAKKRAAEAKAALLKARAEFKEGLDAIRAEMEAEEAAIISRYSRGETKYLDYLTARQANELRYYDRSRQYYEDHFRGLRDYELTEDKDYQKLLSDKESAALRYSNKILALNESVLKRQMEAELREAERTSSLIEDRTIADEEQLSQRRLHIQTSYLQARLSLHAQGSEEREKIQSQLEEIQEKDRYERESRFQTRLREARKKYQLLSVSERYEIEKKAIEALYQLRMRKLASLLVVRRITLKEFQDEMKKANEEQEKILGNLRKEKKKDLPGSDYERTPDEQRRDKERRISQQTAEIDRAQQSGLLTEDEARRMKAKLLKDELSQIGDELADNSSEWVSLISQMSNAWLDLWQAIDSGGDIFTNLSTVAETTFATITAGMQTATQFAQANARIEQAAIEKRYEREIELAQGNTYLTKKLEEEKERKVAEIKNKAAKAEFKMAIIQATGTMIMGAMNAYTSTLKIPIIGPALAPAAAAVALAAGAANLALLTKQQEASEAQGYSQGGYTKKGRPDDVAGVVHAGEWVAPAWMLDNPATAGLIERLEVVRNSGVADRALDVMRDNVTRQNVTGSLTNSDVDKITGVGAAITTARLISSGSETVSGKREDRMASDRASATDNRDRDGDHELRRVIKRLTDRLEEPFVTVNTMTGRFGIKATEDEYKRVMKNRRRR